MMLFARSLQGLLANFLIVLFVICALLLIVMAGLILYYRFNHPSFGKRFAKTRQPPTLYRNYHSDQNYPPSHNPSMSHSSNASLDNEYQPEERQTFFGENPDKLPGDIHGGGIMIQQHIVEESPPPTIAPTFKEQRQPLAILILIRGELEKSQFEIYDDGFVIGRGRGVNLQIKDERVSRKHAVFRYYNGVWFIQDQQSLNGISVNGVKVKATRLNSGDQIEIADWVFRIVVEGNKIGLDVK
jgi:hypothetical protein